MTIIKACWERLTGAWKSLSDYALERGSGEALGLLRILFGGLACLYLLSFLHQFALFFSTSGWLNSSFQNLTATTYFSLLSGARDDAPVKGFLIVTLVASFCMMVGFFSRTATVVATIGLISINGRMALIPYTAFHLLENLAFSLCFAESGAAYSLDSLLTKRRGRTPPPVSLWPQKLIQIQIALVYFSAVLYKAFDPCWTQGHAVYYALHYLSDFQNFWLPEFMRNPPITNLMTYGTLVVEAGLCFLPFIKRYRVPILFLGVVLHVSAGYDMLLPLYGATMIISYISYFRGEEIAQFFRRLKGAAGAWPL
jgi:hypothetical protein